MSFLLHAGASDATLEEVRAVETPDHTDTWYPVPHGVLVDSIKTTIRDHSEFDIASEQYGLWKDGARLFGFYGLENGSIHDDYSLTIGFRNSNDKAFSLGYAVGSRVFVCDNLAFSGEVVFSRKHTRFARRDLNRVVVEAFGQLGAQRDLLDRRIEAYKRTQLSDTQVHDLLIRSCDARVIANAGIAKVLKEWRGSEHEEFAPRTAWSFHNAYTEVFKGSNPVDLTARSLRLHGLLDLVATDGGHDPDQIDLLAVDKHYPARYEDGGWELN